MGYSAYPVEVVIAVLYLAPVAVLHFFQSALAVGAAEIRGKSPPGRAALAVAYRHAGLSLQTFVCRPM